mgnify:CR=1 FL=1
MIKFIKKRDGQEADFKPEKISNAIYKASVAVGESNWQVAEELSKEVVVRLAKKIKKRNVVSVEEIQDVVEQVLIDTAHAKIAKAYILYRQHRAEIRLEKEQILNKSEIDEVDKKFERIEDWQKWAARRFEGIDYKLGSIDHKLDKVVFRPEFEKLENRVRELEDLLAVIRKS